MAMYLLFLFIATAAAQGSLLTTLVEDEAPSQEVDEAGPPGSLLNIISLLPTQKPDENGPPGENDVKITLEASSVSSSIVIEQGIVDEEEIIKTLVDPPVKESSGDYYDIDEPMRYYGEVVQIDLQPKPIPIQFEEISSGDSQYKYMVTATSGGQPEMEAAPTPEKLTACPVVTIASPMKDRVRAWLCEYGKYTVQTISWIESFEVWWAGCEESQDDASIWEDSNECPNTTMVRCKCPSKLNCMDDGMGCKRCMCTDGNYKDATSLFKLWKKEMKMFKKRFQIYKSKVGSCTRADSFFLDECEEDESESPDQENESSGEERESSGEGRESPDQENESSGEERESSRERESINIHL